MSFPTHLPQFNPYQALISFTVDEVDSLGRGPYHFFPSIHSGLNLRDEPPSIRPAVCSTSSRGWPGNMAGFVDNVHPSVICTTATGLVKVSRCLVAFTHSLSYYPVIFLWGWVPLAKHEWSWPCTLTLKLQKWPQTRPAGLPRNAQVILPSIPSRTNTMDVVSSF